MLDYQLVEAFAVVLGEGGFARAADRLCITQSAVSQRVKQLEETIGKALIIRETPPRATEAGAALLRQYRQLMALEEETLDAIGARGARQAALPHRLQLAVNIDSLHVWFIDAARELLSGGGYTVEVLMAGHAQTVELLRSGAVAGCVSSERSAVTGCSVEYLGTLRYALVASAAFAAARFPDGFTREAAERAPIVDLDRSDGMQRGMLHRAFGDPVPRPPVNYFPTADSYVGAVRAGLGYGLVPLLKIRPELEARSLVELDPALRLELPLYWHAWKYPSEAFRAFSDAFSVKARRILSS